MKFKHLIIVFSLFIMLILLAVFFLPSLIDGTDVMLTFDRVFIPFVILVSTTVLGLSIFLFSNYRLLSLLEREDWPALAYYLEQKILVKGRYSFRRVRLLASSYMVMSDFASILKLESKALLAKPSVVDKNILIFGAARILTGNYKDTAVFFKTHKEKCRAGDKQWASWFYGFSSLLEESFSEAERELSALAAASPDPVITGLSAYFLDDIIIKHSLNPADCKNAVDSGRDRLVKALKTHANWKKNIQKSASEVHIAIIRKYIDEAGRWLFGVNA